jgi:hypothetical protein
MFHRLLTALLAGSVLLGAAAGARGARPAPFKHPGIVHTQEDLDRIKTMVAKGAEPWKGAFAVFKAHPQSRADWKLRGPFAVVNRPGSGNLEMAYDANAAYQNALMYCITGQAAHAQKAVAILNAWASRLQAIRGHDSKLAAGLYGFKLVAAAELIRARYPGWKRKDVDQAKKMFRNVLYPVVKDFAPSANGNWDGACMKTVMAIGVFCDDRTMFDRAVAYYRKGRGNGAITHYVLNEAGQCQESGRDQAHVQLGLGLLAECCEIAWAQGIDLYGVADNRLLKGYEYTSKYNLGHDVPFTPLTDISGKFKHRVISPKERGKFRAVYEIAWNHYHHRKGLDMPYTAKVVAKLRPEGASFQADNVGFGTLLFYRPNARGK